ncbi:MAG TPA: carboxypeptidase regulatory-like domain-containing protein [Bryobacteraceae bacterium]|nr:carboxypeptidase regulatory-like domain-containing protein [Bryobacteraceae bacterium]
MRRVVALSLFTLVCSAGAFAQGVAGLGAVSGTVRDASGAVVPTATVVLSNDSKGIKRTMQTTDAGVFSAPALVPATGYSLTVTKQGFANWEAKDFQVQVGQTVDFRIALEISSASTKVDVTAEAPLVEDTKSGVTQVVSQQEIDGLPINGRRADTFVLLTPAVTPDGSFGLVSFRGISSGNSFLTDGNDTTNSFYNENAGRTRISTQISQDAVQEFQVLSDGFSAEFGRAIGGVINTVTRSGTNDYHGTGYEFFRNRTLNAPDRYAAGFNAPEWRHQAGATLGGPIKKDKLFFFSNFELVKRNFPGLNRIINTSFTTTGGQIIPSTCTATAAQCAAAIDFVQKQMEVLVPRTVSSYMGFAKLDWRPTYRNSFSFDANVMHWRSPYGIQTQAVLTSGNMLGGNGNSTVETRYGKASWTSIVSPNAVNELRFGWFKDRLSDPGASDIWPSTGALVISLNGSAVGAAAAYPRTFPSEQRFQLVDNYSWTHGAHSVKFGVDYQTTEDYMNQLFNGAGTYNFASLTNFAKDFSGNTTGARDYSSFSQAFGNPIQDFRTSDINFYAQDTWKVSRRFTLNYGLRYEKSFLPQPTVVDPNYPQTGKIPVYNKDFAPRFSLSYSLSDRTVLRAGYGIFYARFLGDGLDTLYLGNGRYQATISANNTQAGGPVFPNVFPNVNAVPAGTATLTFADQNHFRNPYTQQGTIAIEHQLTHDLAFTASYIWSRGVQIWTSRDLNLGSPTATGTYIIDDTNGNQVGSFTTPLWVAASKVDTRYSHIYEVDNGGQSWYNGLALQLRKRFSKGLSAGVSYTWSHAIDDANQNGASGTITWSQSNLAAGNYPLDKGSSPLDQRHRAVINFLWTPTFTTSRSAAARYLVNGWELSAITTLASAEPVSATVGSVSTANGGVFPAVQLAFSTMNGTGGWNRVPFYPVSSLDVDRIYRVDARLSRNLPFSERVKGSLMFEAFNAFNTQYNTSVNQQAFSVSGNVLKPVAGLGVGNSSQGFPDGTNARRCQVALRIVF